MASHRQERSGRHPGRASEDADTIYFYVKGKPYYEFTNFYIGKPIEIDGLSWQTSEHYFQAQKFIEHPRIMDQVRSADGPRAAVDKARENSRSKRSDWESVKDDVMRKALHAKFTQSKKLKELLLGTSGRKLVERSPVDKYWGDGGDGSGENNLGKQLMELRAKLREK